MGALVLRVVTLPDCNIPESLAWTEYLTEKGEWSKERDDACIYESFEWAELVAKELRGQGDEHAHPAIAEKRVVPVQIRRDRDNAPADFVPPPRPKKNCRKERRKRLEEEMRQDDLRELEEKEIYG